MSLVPIIYRSSDAGAPTLSGTAGSLTAVLDACLVNGYGVGPSAKAGAGWTIAHTGTNKRAYRNSPSTGTGCYLRVDDTGGVNNLRTAAVKGFAAMSGIDVGSDQIPPAADAANGVLVPKSATLDATARAWMIIATERWFYMFTSYMVVTGSRYENTPFFAGDIDSRKPGDLNNFMVSWNRATTYTSGSIQAMGIHYGWNPTQSVANNSGQRSGAIIESSAGVRASWCGIVGGNYRGVASVYPPGAVYGPTYPDPVSGGLLIDRPMVMDGIDLVRGFLPNVWAPFHPAPFANGALVSDLEGFAGITFLVVTVPEVSQSTSFGQVLFDITSESVG